MKTTKKAAPPILAKPNEQMVKATLRALVAQLKARHATGRKNP
jgi:hypothetical protein